MLRWGARMADTKVQETVPEVSVSGAAADVERSLRDILGRSLASWVGISAAVCDFLVVAARQPVSADELRRRIGCSPFTPLLALGSEQPDCDISLSSLPDPELMRALGRLLAELHRLRSERGLLLCRQRQLTDWALCDAVTELPNRRAWQQWLTSNDLACHSPRCVAILDIDHFKQVNDGWGHAAGDRVLRSVGQSLAAGVRSHDRVARIGGDEFGILLEQCHPRSAETVVNRLRALAGQTLDDARGQRHVVSLSAGYCCFWRDGDSLAQAVDQADAALRRAKTEGRNRACGCQIAGPTTLPRVPR